MAIAIDFANLSDNYPINCINGTWTSRTISGQDCLTMVQTANANNNGFILIPTNITVDAYTIIGLSVSSETTNAFLIDANSGYGRVSGYDDFGGFRANSGITRPDLRGIRLQGGSGLTPNYSGNVNGNNISWNNNYYNVFGYYTSSNLPLLIYLPSFVTNILINDQPLIVYAWSSVPAISGKNGILTLSTLKSGSINNGNPVSDATLNAFEILIEASNVGKLVLDTDIDESQVVIRYNIPNNTYQYIKLVYKENYAPESISDGVAIDIQQTDTQLVLDDITTTGTYYFKIFTDNGNSNTVVLNYVGIIPIIIKIERVW